MGHPRSRNPQTTTERRVRDECRYSCNKSIYRVEDDFATPVKKSLSPRLSPSSFLPLGIAPPFRRSRQGLGVLNCRVDRMRFVRACGRVSPATRESPKGLRVDRLCPIRDRGRETVVANSSKTQSYRLGVGETRRFYRHSIPSLPEGCFPRQPLAKSIAFLWRKSSLMPPPPIGETRCLQRPRRIRMRCIHPPNGPTSETSCAPRTSTSASRSARRPLIWRRSSGSFRMPPCVLTGDTNHPHIILAGFFYPAAQLLLR